MPDDHRLESGEYIFNGLRSPIKCLAITYFIPGDKI